MDDTQMDDTPRSGQRRHHRQTGTDVDSDHDSGRRGQTGRGQTGRRTDVDVDGTDRHGRLRVTPMGSRLRVMPMDSGSVLLAMACVRNASRRTDVMNASRQRCEIESHSVSCSEFADLSLVPDPILVLANPSGTHPSSARPVWALSRLGHSPTSHARLDFFAHGGISGVLNFVDFQQPPPRGGSPPYPLPSTLRC